MGSGTGEGSTRRGLHSGSWWLLAAALLVVFGLRLPWFGALVINHDESMFFVVAQDVARGGTLYETAWESKGPLLFLVLAPVIALFGPSILALRIFTTLWVMATMGVVCATGRRLFGPVAGAAAALTYGAFMSTPRYNGLASMAEVFMMLPAAGALHLLVVYLQDPRRVRLLAGCGALATAAVLVKFSALYCIVIIPLLLLTRQLLEPPADGRALVREAAWGAAGALAVAGTLVAVFAAWGNLDDLLFVYRYNAAYMRTTPSGEAWGQLAFFTLWNLTQDPFTMLAVGAIVLVLSVPRRWRERRWLAVLTLGLAATSFLGVALGRNLFFHYYLIMGLPLALAVAFGIGVTRIGPREQRRLAAAGALLLVAYAWSPYRFEAVRRHRDPARDESIRATVAFLDERSSPEDTIFVLGAEPIVYFLAERRAPTRFFVWLHHWDRFRTTLEELGVGPRELMPSLPRWIVSMPRPEQVPQLKDLVERRYTVRARCGQYLVAELDDRPGGDAP